MSTYHSNGKGSGLPVQPTAIATVLATAKKAEGEIDSKKAFEARKHIFWFIANQVLLKELQTFKENHPVRQKLENQHGLRIVEKGGRITITPQNSGSRLAKLINAASIKGRRAEGQFTIPASAVTPAIAVA